ncbi:MAG: hypothetical protein EOM23_01080, partial [Candidatus Moranbacteria bacterium]|nr:hypothetical protein [Candidatus Moranbacteria bacterium]
MAKKQGQTEVLEKPLVVASVEDLKKDPTMFVDPAGILVDYEDPELNSKADAFLAKLINSSAEIQRESIDNIGQETQKGAARSEMLKGQIRTLANKGADGGEVAKSLTDLKDQVETLDPNNFEFSKNFLVRLFGKFPLIGVSLKRYFEGYLSAQEVIDAIIKSLELGKETLIRDNRILTSDQKRMREYKDRLIE